jgi:hypothetical protein
VSLQALSVARPTSNTAARADGTVEVRCVFMSV